VVQRLEAQQPGAQAVGLLSGAPQPVAPQLVAPQLVAPPLEVQLRMEVSMDRVGLKHVYTSCLCTSPFRNSLSLFSFSIVQKGSTFTFYRLFRVSALYNLVVGNLPSSKDYSSFLSLFVSGGACFYRKPLSIPFLPSI
jgi:hypothetical protein